MKNNRKPETICILASFPAFCIPPGGLCCAGKKRIIAIEKVCPGSSANKPGRCRPPITKTKAGTNII